MKSLNLTKPHLIVVVGIPGAGKTYFSEKFADMFGAPYLKLEDLYEFTQDETTLHKLWDFTLDKIIQSKQTLILEGIGATKTERRQLSTYARTRGYQTLYIWVQTEPSTAHLRATKGTPKQKPTHPLSDAEFDRIADAFEPLVAGELYMVISGKHTYASQAKNVLNKLAAPRAEKSKATPVDKRPDAQAPSQSIHTPRGRITIN